MQASPPFPMQRISLVLHECPVTFPSAGGTNWWDPIAEGSVGVQGRAVQRVNSQPRPGCTSELCAWSSLPGASRGDLGPFPGSGWGILGDSLVSLSWTWNPNIVP